MAPTIAALYGAVTLKVRTVPTMSPAVLKVPTVAVEVLA
jgi:hypothetical protein